ncbi:MAG: isoprenylcysteine carboxylmethyltransferase family protein [Planctomycetota bacterium]|nr:isoprenylcysteine carboxylmethyltransferase family protein [Planctomycetota bacterium]
MPSPWWLLKVSAGLALVAWGLLVALGLGPIVPRLPFPPPLAQMLVLVGAGLHLVHYAILKRRAGDLSRPHALVTDVGLFRRIRHPMYLGDLVAYVGLAALSADPIAAGLLVLGAIGLERQAHHEDREMARQFGTPYEDWRVRTRLLIPGLL